MNPSTELTLPSAPVPPERQSWTGYSNLPLQAVVSLPLQRISLEDLARVVPGTALRSAHHFTNDLYLSVHNVFMASVSLEPAGGTRGARLNNFDPRPEFFPVDKASDLAPVSDFPPDAQRLRDCTVPLSLCFGTRTLLLQDAMLLAPGQLLALDVPLLDPVSLLVNNRVVAYGTPMLQANFYSVLVTQLAAN